MDIAVLGAGHLGLVTVAGLVSLGLALRERGEVPFSANAEGVYLASDRRGWEPQVGLEAGLEHIDRCFEALA